ncbi:hypothetical protein J7E81_01400 [Bacillus sp. ISL-18]|uniref:hypothetical protein n=1 Tax=Bacillus sp. ISL-18 TaxID=2819118 RepID=UPI001BE8C09F|nr:hypothetical protein [Bacillus sp. ISL-18]MBT2653901.1 hypothetical protein [Bacillus sp. ISL-18]
MSAHKRADVSTLPSAKWRPDQSGLWREQSYPGRGKKEDVNAVDRGKEDTGEATVGGNDGAATEGRLASAERRIWPVSTGGRIEVRNQGGLVFTIN